MKHATITIASDAGDDLEVSASYRYNPAQTGSHPFARWEDSEPPWPAEVWVLDCEPALSGHALERLEAALLERENDN